MIIGKNSFVKGFTLFVMLVLAILNIIGVTFSLLITAGVVTSALVIWACIRKYREYENENDNI